LILIIAGTGMRLALDKPFHLRLWRRAAGPQPSPCRHHLGPPRARPRCPWHKICARREQSRHWKHRFWERWAPSGAYKAKRPGGAKLRRGVKARPGFGNPASQTSWWELWLHTT